MTPTYSIVIPVHNEQAVLPALEREIAVLMSRLDGPAEIILVDDGSTDASFETMLQIRARDPRYKLARLSRNFGHQLAVTFGLDVAEGAAVVVLDADLQDPPEVVLEMAQRWREGYEVVYGIRCDRSTDTWFKRSSAIAFYRLLARTTSTAIPMDVGDFRLVDRTVVDALRHFREGNRYVRGMFAWMGYRQIGVEYRRDSRRAGVSSYSLRRMVELASNGVIGYSKAPLRASLALGSTGIVAGAVGLIHLLASRFTRRRSPSWLPGASATVSLAGLQMLGVGVIGEYIGRVLDESLDRPLYIVSEMHGLSPTGHPARGVLPATRPLISLLDNERGVRDRAV